MKKTRENPVVEWCVWCFNASESDRLCQVCAWPPCEWTACCWWSLSDVIVTVHYVHKVVSDVILTLQSVHQVVPVCGCYVNAPCSWVLDLTSFWRFSTCMWLLCERTLFLVSAVSDVILTFRYLYVTAMWTRPVLESRVWRQSDVSVPLINYTVCV